VAPRRHQRHLRDRSIESELKFRVAGPGDHQRLRILLRKLDYKLEGTYDEENYRFQGPGKATRSTTLRLRVFDGGPRGVLTAKGPARFVGGVKVREETEVEVKDAHTTLDLLAQLGFQVVVIYRKQRSVWKLGAVNVTLDKLEYGYFTEVEGPLETIPGVAASLGLDPANALKDSYSVLARQYMASEKKAVNKSAKKAAPAASPAL
jgi:predicted adenylyl cyclase CyaB